MAEPQEVSKEEIAAANELFKKFLDVEKELQDGIILKVTYTVSGQGESSIVSDGLFSADVMLMKISGEWKLGTYGSFPSPTSAEILSVLD